MSLRVSPRTLPLFGCAILLLGFILPSAQASTGAESRNIRLVRSFPYTVDEDRPIMDRGGTDMAFQGRYLYAAEQGRRGVGGGVHIFDISGNVPRKVGFAGCGGWQNDVAVVKPGLIAIGYHEGEFNCGNPQGGVTLFDVSDPRRPRQLGTTQGDVPSGDPLQGGGIHTLTVYPGTSLIYASPGGRQSGYETGVETILDVSNPNKPEVAAEFDSGIGCHDLTFDISAQRELAFCTGLGETQIWDVSEPLAPEVIGHVVNPLHAFHHASAVSPDGKLLVIGTETVANECAGGPSGGLFAYDITNPRVPVLVGSFGAQRGAALLYSYPTDLGFDALCAPHLFQFAGSSRTLVSGNGSGGVNIVDFSDPASPAEVGFYISEDRDYWAAYPYRGRIYANSVQALDVFDTDSILP